jgi:hypothetical protein
MNFDISQHLDGAAAAIHNRIHGGGYDALHQSVKNKYRDIVVNTLSGVLLGRTDYADMEAIAADVIRGWGVVSPGKVPVPVTVEKGGKGVKSVPATEEIVSDAPVVSEELRPKKQPVKAVSGDAVKKPGLAKSDPKVITKKK